VNWIGLSNYKKWLKIIYDNNFLPFIAFSGAFPLWFFRSNWLVDGSFSLARQTKFQIWQRLKQLLAFGTSAAGINKWISVAHIMGILILFLGGIFIGSKTNLTVYLFLGIARVWSYPITIPILNPALEGNSYFITNNALVLILANDFFSTSLQ